MTFVHTNDPAEFWYCLTPPRSKRRLERVRAMQRAEPVKALPPKLAPKTPPKAPEQSRVNLEALVERLIYDKQRYKQIYAQRDEKASGKLPKTRAIIMQEVAEKYNISVEQIKPPRRKRYLVKARQEYFYRAWSETSASFPQIARYCGDRDHTTAMHGVRKYAADHGLPYER